MIEPDHSVYSPLLSLIPYVLHENGKAYTHFICIHSKPRRMSNAVDPPIVSDEITMIFI